MTASDPPLPDVYLVYGWKIGPGQVKAALADMKPEALNLGLRVVFAPGGKDVFVGKVLSSVGLSAGVVFGSAGAPAPEEIGRLRKAMGLLGLGRVSESREPELWTVVG